jgi:micrococcal nuclease
MNARFLLLFHFIATFLGSTAHGASPDALPLGGSGVVETVIDGDTVRLQNGSVDIRMVGIQAPKLPLGRKGFKAWPLAAESRQALEGLVQGRTVTLRLGSSAQDRNGRTLAHLVRNDGLWVQGEMLRLGFARVYTFPDNRQLAQEMLEREALARTEKRGLWTDPFYAVRDSQSPSLLELSGTYQLVDGIVRDAAATKDRTYLNFGDDFRSDFTVAIDRTDLKRFVDAGVNVLDMKGKRIEVRGWITKRNGPMIEVTHPEQIARLN